MKSNRLELLYQSSSGQLLLQTDLAVYWPSHLDFPKKNERLCQSWM